MADDLVIMYDYFETCSMNGFYSRVILPQSNPFTALDDKKFKERYWLSKPVVLRLLHKVNVNYYRYSLQYYSNRIKYAMVKVTALLETAGRPGVSSGTSA